MATQDRPSPGLNGEGAAFGKATPSQSVRLATRTQGNPTSGSAQDEARACEGIARRHALAALCLGGAMALQEAALSRHYAGRSAALMIGGAQ